ncbi:MAG TPA: hypothetical protein PLW42_12495, partial [Anaerohalosphaeraceae bacterium]|nr:hypothetical protein [Anaerohalosphaeraceae bacterium]
LLLYGKAATAQKAEDGGIDESNPNRFAQKWEDWMLPYAEALQTSFTQAMTSRPHAQSVPGAITVWYEDSFSSTISGIDFSQYPEGELVIENCQQITKNSIWDWNGTGTPTPQQEQWYKEYDDWRPGTPFLLTGCSDARNNGFYRVLSRRMSGSTLYLRACDNSGQPVSFYADSQGTISCNFGGDWWTIRGMNGHETASSGYADEGPGNFFDNLEDATYQLGITNQWWTWKDQYHRYEGNARGPHDGRPPSGGPFAIDFNGDWIRGVNPYLYHCYDTNSHRYILKGDFDSLLFLYFAGWRADEFLSIQVDPKEQVPPYFFVDKENAHWKYGGKVPIRKNQISNPARLGPVNQCLAQAWQTQSSGWVAIATHRQYLTSTIRAVGTGYMISYGDAPPLEILLSPRDWWEQLKFDTAIQNMVEYTAEQYGWMMAVDDTYKENWFAVNHPSWMPPESQQQVPYLLEYELYNGDVQGRTYQQIYADKGISAYRPDCDPTMPAYAELHDELWGENGSAIELILKKLGSNYYDWFYDDITPFISERIHKFRAKFLASENPQYWQFPTTIHGVVCNNLEDVANVCWPIPLGTWRRTWKRTLGYIREGKMRSSSLGDPTCQNYENYSWTGPYEDYHLTMPGHHRFTAPSQDDYGGEDLSANHGPNFEAEGREYYTTRIYQILNDCRMVLKQLNVFQPILTNYSLKYFYLHIEDYFKDNNGPIYFPNKEAIIAIAENALAENYISDVSQWSSVTITLVGHHLPIRAEAKGYCVNNFNGIPYYYESAVVLECEQYDSNAVYFLIRLKINYPRQSLWAACGGSDSPIAFGITKVGTVNVPRTPKDSNYDLYGYLLIPVRPDADEPSIIRIRSIYNFANLGICEPVYEGQYLNNSITTIEVAVFNENDFLTVFDFTKISGKIWRRLKEKADVYLIDIFGDDVNPPKYENAFWQTPTLYNSNWFDLTGNPIYDSIYDYDEHNPEYRVRAESVLMEDLEGIDKNEVKYLFDFEDTALADEMDKEQTSRLYDERLLEGDHDAAQEVFEDGWNQGIIWNCKLNSRDSAQARGNPQNNYGTPTEPEVIALDKTIPVFPLRPKIYFEHVQISGVWYDHIWVDPPFAEGGTVQYRLSRFDASVFPPGWAIIFSFGEQKPSAPSGYPDGPNHFWLDSTYGVSQNSEFSYRIQCNRLGVGRGMWSLPTSELRISLTINNSPGYIIKLNGVQLTFTNGVWIGTLPYYEEFTLLCEDPGYYFAWYIQWPGGGTSSSDNPLTQNAFADLVITAW